MLTARTMDTMSQSQSQRVFCGFNIRDLLSFVASLALPLMLGIFTVVITFDQRKEARLQRLEDQKQLQAQRAQDLNISALQRELDIQLAEKRRTAEDLNAEKQRTMSQDQREHELATERARYLDTLLLTYINDIGVLLKDNNGSLTSNPVTFALARAKSLNVIGQLGSERNSQLLQFLYDARQLSVNEKHPPFDLSGAQLNAIDLSTKVRILPMDNLVLAGAFLNNASFAGQPMKNVNFEGAQLRGAIFSQSSLHEADFNRAVLTKANFSFATFYDISFYHADLSDAVLTGVQSQVAIFKRSQLRGVDFTDVKFSVTAYFTDYDLAYTNFRRANLEVVYFDFCEMSNTDMTDAILTETGFRGSRLVNATMVHLQMDYSVNFDWIDLTTANFTGTQYFDSDMFDQVLSIQDAILPDGTVGQFNPPFVRNGEAQCNSSLADDWQQSSQGSGKISIIVDAANKNNCLFALILGSSALIGQTVDLRKYRSLIEEGRASYRLSFECGEHGEVSINEYRNNGSLIYRSNGGKRLHQDTTEIRVYIEFYTDGSYSNEVWCDNVMIDLTAFINISSSVNRLY